MPKTSSERTATITVRVGVETKRGIARCAAAREMTASEFIRYCVRVYMDNATEGER